MEVLRKTVCQHRLVRACAHVRPGPVHQAPAALRLRSECWCFCFGSSRPYMVLSVPQVASLRFPPPQPGPACLPLGESSICSSRASEVPRLFTLWLLPFRTITS